MANQNHFPPTYLRPLKANPSIVSRMYRLDPISQCLESALDEIMEQQNKGSTFSSFPIHDPLQDDDASNNNSENSTSTIQTKKRKLTTENDDHNVITVDPGNNMNTSTVKQNHDFLKFSNTFKQKILQSYGKAISNIHWDDDSLIKTRNSPTTQLLNNTNHSSIPNDKNTINSPTNINNSDGSLNHNTNSFLSRNNSTTQLLQNNDPNIHKSILPPAAKLIGKLKYYNRINGQWRIVLQDAKIMPLNSGSGNDVVTIDHGNHDDELVKENHHHNHRTKKSHSLHLDGDVLLLAYDDDV